MVVPRNFDRTRKLNSDGFSLLEIVIAVGLLLIVTSVGAIAIQNFDESTKKAATQRAAREVYNVARANVEDGNPNTSAQDAATEYNNSQSSRTVNNNRPITVKVIQNSSNPNDLTVQAFYDGGGMMSAYSTPTAEGGSGGSGGSEGGVVVPIIEDTISQLTYQCDSTMTGHLPVYNISDSTTVSLIGSDGSEKMVNYSAPNLTQIESSYSSINFTKHTGFHNVSERLTMKAGVTYTVKVYGKFTNLSSITSYTADNTHGTQLSFRDCLISVDKLGKHTGLLSFNWVGAAKFVSVPKEIPNTIVNMNCVFASAINFNDPNVKNWDTQNVTELYYAFLYNRTFNQDLSGWDVGNVWNFTATFHQTNAYNNGGKPLLWDTSKATNMNSLFNTAAAFNQNLAQRTDSKTGQVYWDTSKVTTMSSMFKNALVFNNGGTARSSGAPQLIWRTDSVTNMSFMFDNAPAFNSLIYRTGVYWNTSKVTNFNGTFRNAKAFNRGIGNWLTNSAVHMDEMFSGATSFNQPLTSWNVTRVKNHNNFNTGGKLSTANYPRFN